jgi:antitoxin ParD1/3/4
MPTQNVNLTETQAEFIHRCVEAGEYNNASELVREALRLLKTQKEEHQARVEYLRGELQKAYDARERGEYVDLKSGEDILALRDEMRRSRLSVMTNVGDAATSPQ